MSIVEDIKRDLEGRDDNSSAYATVREVRELISQLTAANAKVEELNVDITVITIYSFLHHHQGELGLV